MSKPSTLLLRLQGPMQSWGTTSRFDERDTQLDPSKSGVIGLVCAALGRNRSEPVNDLASLRMGVRVDREGALRSDYHTVQGLKGLVNAMGKVQRDRTVVSRRYYLSDAVFLVGLEGERTLLEQCHTALRNPVWPLALGRKSFIPSMPVYLAGGLVEQPLELALTQWSSLLEERYDVACLRSIPVKIPCRILIEDKEGREGSMRLDQPIGPFSERRFGPRFIKSTVFFSENPHVS